ncbi:MAG: hypothetical protein MZV64_59530 [Ignavibacteriales bacterium]|nr:hypothetical protein [Ignavibacteriales bacterium]
MDRSTCIASSSNAARTMDRSAHSSPKQARRCWALKTTSWSSPRTAPLWTPLRRWTTSHPSATSC